MCWVFLGVNTYVHEYGGGFVGVQCVVGGCGCTVCGGGFVGVHTYMSVVGGLWVYIRMYMSVVGVLWVYIRT